MPLLKRNSASAQRFLPFLWGACILYPVFHLLVLRFSSHEYTSYFFRAAFGLIKAACCIWWFTKLPSSPARFRWLLLCAGILLASVGHQIYAWRDLIFRTHNYVSGQSVFFFSLACIPILLAIGLTFTRKDPAAVREIDLVLSLTLGYLFLVQIFSIVSIDGATTEAGVTFINRLIDFQNFFLPVCATFQFLGAADPEDRRFFYVVSTYYWIAAPLQAVRNRAMMHHPSVFWDIAIDAPVLIFVLLTLSPRPAWVRDFHP
jgi:hypothetical protein